MDIKKLRKRFGLTQEEMAHKLGVERITIIRWEAGTSKPSQLAQRQIDRLERRSKP